MGSFRQRAVASLMLGAIAFVGACETSSTTGGKTPPPDSGGGSTLLPTDSPFSVKVELSWESDVSGSTDNEGLEKSAMPSVTCSLPSTASEGDVLNCPVTFPEGLLHFANIKFTTGGYFREATDGTRSVSCTQVIFRPYYYLRSTSSTFSPEESGSAIDCSKSPLDVDCYGGPAKLVVESFPAFTGIYKVPERDHKDLQTAPLSKLNDVWPIIPSANEQHLSSNRWTANSLVSASRGIMLDGEGDGYIANSMRDWSFQCVDQYAQPLYTIILSVSDEDTVATGDADDPEDNQFPDWNSAQDPGNFVSTPVASIEDKFYIKLNTENKYSFWEHLQGDVDGDATTEYANKCEIDPVAGSQDLTCEFDANELDLWYFGAKLRYNVPAGMCKYVSFMPFYYENYRIHDGPDAAGTAISYVVDKNSVAGLDNFLADGITPGQDGLVDTPAPFVNSDGTLNCDFDYTGAGGPNCCTGSSSVTKEHWDTTANAYVSDPTTTHSWGGSPSSCIAGPAVDTQPKNAAGFPIATITQAEAGLHDDYSPPSPSSKGWGNFYISNYYTAAKPSAFRFDHYQWNCLDEAGDIKARIRVVIREYDEITEFLKRSAGNLDSGAGGGTDANPFSPDALDGQLDDVLDWLRIAPTGGTSGYPMAN